MSRKLAGDYCLSHVYGFMTCRGSDLDDVRLLDWKVGQSLVKGVIGLLVLAGAIHQEVFGVSVSAHEEHQGTRQNCAKT